MMLSTLGHEYKNFSLLLRGHAHYFVHVAFHHSQGVICPCWKGRDEFAARRSLAYMPHLGYIVINIDKNITVEPHIFTLEGKDIINEVVV